MSRVKFREAQRQIIEGYQGGMMGISAVPGSGKTFTLSHLAARLVERLAKTGEADQEVLIVTFSNSAVNGFKRRIGDILQQERKLLPNVGYMVRTLHGLAHDIVRERPALVGLADDFQILDERITAQILRDVVTTQLKSWDFLLERYAKAELSERQLNNIQDRHFPELLVNVALRFIKTAKDYQISTEMLESALAEAGEAYDLARFMTAVYGEYQRLLRIRGAVDFDDLVYLALLALQNDAGYLARLRTRWAYVLEDEAQDSSALQEKMLRLLTLGGNWVRVGDPNQAINTTFTTADPRYLIQFLAEKGVIKRDLPTSGRSSRHIIDFANTLVDWTVTAHPIQELRGAFYPQAIQPTAPNDPQPNPPTKDSKVYINYKAGRHISPEREIEIVVDSVARYLADNADKTIAVLVPENSRGFKLAEAMRAADLPYEELLRSTTGVRDTAAQLQKVLDYLAEPQKASALAGMFRAVWYPYIGTGLYDAGLVGTYLQNLGPLEQVIYGEVEISAADLKLIDGDPIDLILADLGDFLDFVRYALDALLLPIQDLVLVLSQRLFSDPADIALAYKIAGIFSSLAEANPTWRLSDFAKELEAIASNQRKLLGFEDTGEGYNPKPGVITIATMHAAKGLEWDRVYLMAVNSYSFPSALPQDTYISERWFLQEGYNLEADLLAQLYEIAHIQDEAYAGYSPSEAARFSYSAERLRLLYVAITRARRDLIITWNTGRLNPSDAKDVKVLALPILALQEHYT